MARQLNIRSDEAHRLAHIIAERTNMTVSEVVLQSLRDYGVKLPPEADMTPAHRAAYEHLRALNREAAKHKKPGVTSDHTDMYDEFGLPI